MTEQNRYEANKNCQFEKNINTTKKVYVNEYETPSTHTYEQKDVASEVVVETKNEKKNHNEFEVRTHFKEDVKDVSDEVIRVLKNTYIRDYLEKRGKVI